ncbi:hypothetical protein MBLNU459_g8395t1 [Dothideomycetes sp. NU459]
MSNLESASLFSVKGLVAVVTGGGSGIGLMMAKALALNGAHKVYIVGRRKEVLEAAAKHSPNIVPIVGDVTSKDSLRAIAAQVQSEVGFINLLVANSGAMGSTTGVKSDEVSVAEYAKAGMNQSWDDIQGNFAVNTTAVLFTAYAFLELLDAGNKKKIFADTQSQILVTSSIAGYLRTANSSMAYKISKAATTHMTKNLSGELVPYGIRVNALAPGLFPTDLAAGLIGQTGATTDPTKEGAIPNTIIPAGRTGSEEDMAGTLLFLASRAGAYMNGLILVMDGGRLSVMVNSY